MTHPSEADVGALLLTNALDAAPAVTEAEAAVVAAVRTRAQLCDALVQRLLRPLVGNLLRSPSDARFRSIAASQRLLAVALGSPGVAGARELLLLAGFELAAVEGQSRWVVPAPASARLLAADRCLSLWEERGAAPQAPAVESRAAQRMKDETAAVRARIEQDRQEVAARLVREREAEEAATAGKALDIAAAAPLVEVAKRTIHFTGRLRNAAFGARHFTLRRMEHGRAYACTCDGPCLEAHWHANNANMSYVFLVHLSPDAERVLHVAPELGYMYNSMPHTEHFGKTVLQTRKLVVEEDGTGAAAAAANTGAGRALSDGAPTSAPSAGEGRGALVMNEALNQPAEVCAYCQEPWSKLWD